MAKQTDLFLAQRVINASATLTSSNTTAWVTVYTSPATGDGGDDALLKGLQAVSDDTAAINCRVGVDIGGTVYQLGTVNIPAASGTNGTTAAVDLINMTSMPGLPLDANGKRYLPLAAGNIVKVACLATMTAAKTLTVNAIVEEY